MAVTSKSRVEEAVEALPVLSQQRMARLSLKGWRFVPQNSTQLWVAIKRDEEPRIGALLSPMAGTLYTLLERMVDEDDRS